VKSPGLRNVAASVRQKLLNIASGKGEDFGLILTRYALERLLYRLSQSEYSDQFVLKGAMLFQVWAHAPHRPTRDLDLLGRGEPSPARCENVFQEICATQVPDAGLIFTPESVSAQRIKEEQQYEGVRVKSSELIPDRVRLGPEDLMRPLLPSIVFA